jgi:hypothetical protein
MSQYNEVNTTIMVLLRDTRRFEITVEEQDDVWIAKLQGFSPDRLYPTSYLLRQCTTRQAAIEALQRKWHLLFPDEDALVWHEPAIAASPNPSRRPRYPEDRGA